MLSTLLALTLAGSPMVSSVASPEGPIFTNPATMSSVILRLPLTVSTADECPGASIPGVTFSRSSSATCTKTDGTVVTLSANQPRVTAAGLLIEGGATNLLLQSESLDNAVWSKSGTPTVTANAAVAPDGNTTADTITIDGPANTTASIQQALSGGTAGASYTPSIYIKRVSETGTISIANPGASANGQWDVDLSLLGTGWNRITPTHPAVTVVAAFTYTSGGVGGVVFRTKVSGALTLNVWGAQVETGSIATSHIPTAGTSAARTADVASVAQPAGLTDTAGCVGATFNVSSSVATNTRVIAFGGINRLAASGSTGLVANDGTNGAAVTISSFVGRSVRAIARWSGSTLTLEADGSTGSASYDGSILSDPIYLGSTSSGSASLNGTISNVQFGRTSGACQ